MDQGFPRFDLNGQVALVTGAARGLGRAISLALAHAGADVALGLRDVNKDEGLPEQVEALGRKVLPLQMDMTRMAEINAAVDETVGRFGKIDILVNNDLFREPSGGAGDDSAEKRVHYQHELAGGFCGAPNRIGLLHDEGRHRASDEVPSRRVGQIQPSRQRCCTYVHSYAWD